MDLNHYHVINKHHNIPNEIPKVGYAEGSVYADLTPTLWGREVVSKNITKQFEKETTREKKSRQIAKESMTKHTKKE